MRWCPDFIVWALLALWLMPSCGSDGCGSGEPTTAAAAQESPEASPAPEEARAVQAPAEATQPRARAAQPGVAVPSPMKARPSEAVAVQDQEKSKKPARKPAEKPLRRTAMQDGGQDGDFAANAFPPTLSDTKQHRKAWRRNVCLRCHETGVGEAPEVRHEGMPDLLKVAKCRSCHVFEPGKKPSTKKRPPIDAGFADFAFPPMIPASGQHRKAWRKDDCLLCHEDGLMGAPIVRHEGLPPLTLKAKCRTCHVQVRVLDSDPKRH